MTHYSDERENERIRDSLQDLKSKTAGRKASLVNDFIEDLTAVVKLIKNPVIQQKIIEKLEDEKPETKIQDLLTQWGKWSRTEVGISNYYSEADDNDYWITDDIGLWVEAGVSKLGINRPLQKEAIDYFYKKRHNVPMTAHAMRIGETKVRSLISNGENWIEGFLESNKLAA